MDNKKYEKRRVLATIPEEVFPDFIEEANKRNIDLTIYGRASGLVSDLIKERLFNLNKGGSSVE